MFALRHLARSHHRTLSQVYSVPRFLSSTDTSKYNIRRAELRDKEKVLRLGAEVPTVDKLPAFYESFLSDPHRHCYVLERSGELVAYSHAHIVDGGTTLAFHDIRLGQQDDERDNYRFLLTYSTIKNVRGVHPDVENATVVLSDERDSLENLDAVYKVVGKQKYHAIKITEDNVHTINENLVRAQPNVTGHPKHATPSYLTPSEAVSVATRVSGISSFFGGDRIILMGESYRPTHENFVNSRHIFKHILATFERKSDLKAISFRNSFSHGDSVIHTLDTFCEDKNLFADHFRHQLIETMSDKEERPLHFFVQIPSVLSIDEFVEFCAGVGFHENDMRSVCDYVLGEISCKVFQQAAAAHLASEAI